MQRFDTLASRYMRFSYQSRSATAIFWALHFHHHHHSLKDGHFQVSPVPGGGERSAAIGQGRVPQDLQDEALGHQRGPCQVKVLVLFEKVEEGQEK